MCQAFVESFFLLFRLFLSVEISICSLYFYKLCFYNWNGCYRWSLWIDWVSLFSSIWSALILGLWLSHLLQFARDSFSSSSPTNNVSLSLRRRLYSIIKSHITSHPTTSHLFKLWMQFVHFLFIIDKFWYCTLDINIFCFLNLYYFRD